MTFEPLLVSSLAIRVHVATIVPAGFIGAWLLWAPKSTALHRLLGRVWMILMVATSGTSFFIHGAGVIGGYSPIHILSIATIAGAVSATIAAIAGRIADHRRLVGLVYFGGIVLAGFFTLVPGRIMNRMIFSAPVEGIGDPTSIAAFVGLTAVILVVVLVIARLLPDSRNLSRVSNLPVA